MLAATPKLPQHRAVFALHLHATCLGTTVISGTGKATDFKFLRIFTGSVGTTGRGKNLKLDGQGKARREAARRLNSECKINFSSQNSSRSNGSRPTAVQRAVIGRRRSALVANRLRRRVRRRLNMSVINTGGGAHWTGGRRGAPDTSCYLWA